jgi:adenine phosphoribosyltransferase
MTNEARDAYLRSLIRDVPDFPQPGIVFKDITTLIRDRDGFRQVVEGITNAHRGVEVDLVVGVESRGFIFAAPVAIALGAGLVPVRKPGKLPAKVISQAYALEYGQNVLELHADAIVTGQRVLVIDDVLATGGSLEATISLVEALGGTVVGVSVVIELAFLGGRDRLARPDLHALLTYPPS